MNTVILVGRRAGDPWRDRLWRYCEERWQKTLPGVPIIEGHHGGPLDPDWLDAVDQPFCLSQAFNRAAMIADAHGRWDVALLVGADWIAGTGRQVREAIEQSAAKGRLVFAHNRTAVYGEDVTRQILELDTEFRMRLPGDPGDGGSWHDNTFSGVLAVPRSLWDEVGGFDERFIGWGWDDLAFWSACCALAGYERVDGEIAHLWHPRSRADNEEQPHHPANQVLGERYLAAKWSRDEMRRILAERTA